MIKSENKDKLKIVLIMLLVVLLFIYSFYIHRNEPHWFEITYVKVVE